MKKLIYKMTINQIITIIRMGITGKWEL